MTAVAAAARGEGEKGADRCVSMTNRFRKMALRRALQIMLANIIGTIQPRYNNSGKRPSMPRNNVLWQKRDGCEISEKIIVAIGCQTETKTN
jgi:hypothetical protein